MEFNLNANLEMYLYGPGASWEFHLGVAAAPFTMAIYYHVPTICPLHLVMAPSMPALLGTALCVVPCLHLCRVPPV